MNPVCENFADAFADPSVLEVEDGYWHPHGPGESPRGSEEGKRVGPMVPAL